MCVTHCAIFKKMVSTFLEMHDAKTKNGRRTIPLTTRALEALKRQRIQKQKILFKEIENKRNSTGTWCLLRKTTRPTQQFIGAGGNRCHCKPDSKRAS